MRELLEKVERGIAYHADHGSLPRACPYVPYNDNDLGWYEASGVTHEELQKLFDAGLAGEAKYEVYAVVYLTYEGRKKLLEEQGFDFKAWWIGYGYRVCCDKAIPRRCVCMVSTLCPEHGMQCHGTHD